MNNPRIEDYVIFHHAEYGGAVRGELRGEMRCGECAAIMSAFVSDADEVHVRKPKPRFGPSKAIEHRKVPLRCKSYEKRQAWASFFLATHDRLN